METIDFYDAVVIGAGQGGVPLAVELAQAGWKTAMVEREHVAGTCINKGCTPTKTMIASARVAYLARRGADYGVNTEPVSVDLVKVRQRKRNIVNSWRSSGEQRLTNAGVNLLMGEGKLLASGGDGTHSISVRMNDGSIRELQARKVFLNTGARPHPPDLPGLDGINYLDSTSIMELESVPEHLLVLGGGYIGLEFGQMFRRFGSQVTIVEMGGQLLPREDEDITAEITKILAEDGIELLLGSTATRVEQDNQGKIYLSLQNSAGELQIRGSHLLVATGRTPNTEDLGLEEAGVQTNGRGFVVVNSRLETSVEGIYALGDMKGGPAFTHISYDDYRIIRTNLLEGGEATVDGRYVPYTVFIDPQLGRVGMTEREAKSKGRNYKVAQIPMTYVARAMETDESRGLMKAIIDADNDRILGVAFLGIDGGELMSMVQIAMIGDLPYTALKDATFAHPTLSESLNTLFMSLDW